MNFINIKLTKSSVIENKYGILYSFLYCKAQLMCAIGL